MLRRSWLTAFFLTLVGLPLAQAEIVRIGGTNVAYAKGPSVRFPDVAYDSLHDVYLVVSGEQPIEGRFVDAAGTPIGHAFRVSPSQAVTTSRVDFSPLANAFLVTWLDEQSRAPGDDAVVARLVRFDGQGGPQFLSGEIVIGVNGIGKHTESAPSVACATTIAAECLVTWAEDARPWNVMGQRIDAATGARIGGEIPIAVTGNWEAHQSVAYNSVQHEYFIVNMSEGAGIGQHVVGHRVKAGTGAVLGHDTLYGHFGENNYPDVAYNSQGNLYMVISWYVSSRVDQDVYGRLVSGDGHPIGAVIPVAAGPFFEGGNGIGIAYNAVHDGFFAVFQGPNRETAGVELNGLGIPISTVFDAMRSGARADGEIYQPRIAAATNANRYLIATSVDFARVSVQLMGAGGSTAPPPPRPPPPAPKTIDLTPDEAPDNGNWFMAEGVASSTDHAFNTYYLLANEHDVAVTVRAYFARDNGQPEERLYSVAARSRLTVDLREQVGFGSFGSVFQSLTPGYDIFVERSVYWGPYFEGSTGEVATNALSTVWHFAEGSCGCHFWSNYFFVFNPSQQSASITVTYALDTGELVQTSHVVGPQGRVTFLANDVPQVQNHDFGTTITSNVPVVAERAMYWGSSWLGGHVTMGTRAASPFWAFAEGAAMPGFDTFYLLMNPTPTPTTVNATFALVDQPPIAKSYTLAGHTRRTLSLFEELGYVNGTAARFDTDGVPIIVERSVYWAWQGLQQGWVDGTNSLGASRLAAEWHVPEGATTSVFEDFLLLYNPNPFPIVAEIAVFTDAGQQGIVLDEVAPMGRETHYMHQILELAGLPRHSTFATRVRTQDGSLIAVEHAQYFNRDDPNYWRSGSAVFGIPRP